MPSWIDGSLYPDTEVPEALGSLADRVDFSSVSVAHGISACSPAARPSPRSAGPDWSEAVDATRLLTSPSYHLVRTWHGLPPLPYLGQQLAYIRDDPSLQFV